MNSGINVKNWLINNGFERFVDLFEENEIDGDVLSELSREDLRDLGLPLGAQKKMLKQLELLSNPELAQTPSKSAQQESGVAENRQLTVMFCDLVGSTALSSEMDTEAFREIIVAYQAACDSVIKQYEGYIARLFGDGILVYFGYPEADENDPERAVHTGLKLIDAMAILSSELGDKIHTDLGIRVGIATGPTVVGDLIGEGVAQESVALGDTPNLAARVQGLAQANQVVIAPATHRLLKGRFEFQDLGDFDLKGIPQPVKAWSVLRSLDSVSRFEATRSDKDSNQDSLVGREEEIDILYRRWQRTMDGEGQVVLIGGEAGIGKSRLAQGLLDLVDRSQLRFLRYQCSPYQINSALYPIIEQIRHSAKFETGDDEETRLNKIKQIFENTTNHGEVAISLIAELLSIPVGEHFPLLKLTPQQKKDATFEVLKDQLLGLSRDVPILILFEDIHWADPTTLEILEYLFTLLRDFRVMAMMTHRPEFKARWSGESNTTLINLGKLRPSNCHELIMSLCAGKPLPDEVNRLIAEKTDGVPLFVEELTKSLLETGALTEHEDHYSLDTPLPPTAVPDTLQDSLMARLDRLKDAKEIAQVAAVIGREFSLDLLTAVLPSISLEQALNRLQDAGIIFKQGSPLNPRFLFKHALTRDTAYDSMLKSKRRKIHGQIAEALANSFPERAATEPHLMAGHYSRANLLEQAVPCWIKAAHIAYSRFANLESISHTENGLDTISKLPNSPERIGQQLQLQFLRGATYRVTQGYASEIAEKSFREAMNLARQLNLIDHYADATRGLFAAFYVSGRLQESLQLGKELLAAAQTPMQEMQARYMMASIYFWFGDLHTARTFLEQSLQLYDDKALTGLALQLDPGVMAQIYDGLTSAYLGEVNKAVEQSSQVIQRVRDLQQPLTLGQTLLFGAMSAYHTEQKFMTEVLQLRELSLEHKIPFQIAAADCFIGLDKIYAGNIEEGLVICERGFDTYCSLGARSGATIMLCFLARGCIANKQPDEALKWLEQAMDIASQTGELINEPELYLLQGEAMLLKQKTKKAEQLLQSGLQLARKQSARLHELRNANELAGLWQRQGKQSEALALLKPIHDSFNDNLNIRTLQRTAQLLAELSN